MIEWAILLDYAVGFRTRGASGGAGDSIFIFYVANRYVANRG